MIRHLPYPEDGERVESGPVQFGDDWPGVFIRGDNAAFYAMILQDVINDTSSTGVFTKIGLSSLYKTLTGCIVGPAGELFDSTKITKE